MKIVALIVVVGCIAAAHSVSLTAEQKEKVLAYHKDCRASSGVDPELITRGRKGDFADDAKLKNFIHCFFKKAGFQNEAGEIQVDVIKAKMPTGTDPAEAERVINVCKDKKGTDAADTAFQVYTCYWTSTDQHISLV